MQTAAALPHAPALSGDELLAQARSGSDSAFAALVREHQAMVFGMAYHFLQSRAQAEELAQDVFLALHQNLPRVESARHLVFWLRRVTSNRCIDLVEARNAGASCQSMSCMSKASRRASTILCLASC